MAGKKAATLLVKLLSTAGTGYFYVARWVFKRCMAP
jgi:ribosomal protein L33